MQNDLQSRNVQYNNFVLQTKKSEGVFATQCAALTLQCAVMCHTKKGLEQAAQDAESKAVACIEESQQLYRHAEQTQARYHTFPGCVDTRYCLTRASPT